MKKLFLALLLSWLLPVSAQAATKYVNKSGSNGARNCTNNTTDACLTIDYALGKMTGGDTLMIGDGTYTEPIRQSGWPSGSGTTYTTLMAQNNKQVTINTTSNFALYNADSHHIAFDGIIIALTTTWANGTHHITLRNGELKDGRNQSGDCLLANGSGNQLINNKIHNCGDPSSNQSHNVYWGGDNGLIEGNDFYDNQGGYLLQVQYTGAFQNQIRNNRFHNDNGPSLRAVIISCYDPAGSGAHDNFFYNNLLYNNSGSALRACATNTAIYSNTFYGNDTGVEIYGGSNTIKNNILYNNGTDYTTSAGTITASNNMCATTCSFGSSNQSGNPNFVSVDPASVDFLRLLPGSPAINTGTPNISPGVNIPACSGGSVTNCYNGTLPDIGALETGVPTAGGGPPTLTPNLTSVAAGAQILLTVDDDDVNERIENTGDWVGIWSSPDGTFIDWFWMNGAKVAPTTAISDAVIAFTAPSTPGAYEFRFYQNGSSLEVDRLATAAFTVIAPGIVMKFNVSSLKIGPSVTLKIGTP